MTKFRVFELAVVTVLIAALTIAATLPNEDADVSSAEAEDVLYLMSGNEPTVEIQETLGGCRNGGEHVGFEAAFEEIDDWIAIDPDEQLHKVERRSTQQRSEVLTLRGKSEAKRNNAQRHNITIHPEFEVALDWGLREASAVHLGVDVNGVTWVVLAELDNGDPVFLGPCGSEAFSTPLAAIHGAKYKNLAPGLVSRAGQDLASFAAPGQVRKAAIDEPVFLNPADSEDSLLQSLRSVVMVFKLTDELAGHVVCSETREGWNDCVPVDSWVYENGGEWLEQYVGANGQLDFYLFGPEDNLNEPAQELGSIRINPGILNRNRDEPLAIEITLSPDPSSPGSYQVKLTDTAQNDIDILLDDPEWAFTPNVAG